MSETTAVVLICLICNVSLVVMLCAFFRSTR